MSRIFGKAATGDRLRRILASPNYKSGRFQNQSFTPDMSEDATMWKLLKAFRARPKSVRPPMAIPAQQPDFDALRNASSDALIWFGHSSYLLRASGKTFLVDPVFSQRASPMPGFVKAFAGTDIVKPAQLPEIDYVIISHDHYDHLDYDTVRQLKHKVGHWICSLGTAPHLEYWGIPADRITELDWWGAAELGGGFTVTATPGRHFSGRLKRAQSLWASYVLQTPEHSYFIGGDSGFDAHFEEIGKRFGPFDLAILECGQYNAYWKHIHMMPEETALAAEQLGAKALLPVHWGKFNLALHPWDESIERVLKAAAGRPYQVLTPALGQTVLLNSGQAYDQPWWRLPG
jgi:L-ascorbate metabolism protein UlaG (beta-lactamase superfamily)